ncbi:hypothetical protein AB0N05_34170 [Nocardia sp. NPDC051030]|uniref:LppU/SCO3897 family protein n=1 Tax=Nocardia sp. NPDC051030 TaxID=3155162 RepID=UPI00341F53C5
MSSSESPRDPSVFGTANGVYCRYCGSTPAVAVDFRAHRGLILLMQFRTMRGPVCRDCGLALFRKMTGDSLVQGWWGPLSAMVFNPFTIFLNLTLRPKVAKLPPPIPGAPSLPMDPGKPLTRRWQILGPLLPPALIGLIALWSAADNSGKHSDSGYQSTIYTSISTVAPVVPTTTTAAAPTSADPKQGDCVWNTHGRMDVSDSHPDIQIIDCADPRAQAEVLANVPGILGKSICERYPKTDIVYTVTWTGAFSQVNSYILCLHTK